jgi:hypothetical protein
MGQVIHLDTPAAAYPTSADALDFAETLLLRAIRGWVADHRRGEPPMPRLCSAMRAAGVHDVALSVNQLMAIRACTAQHPIAVHCLRCPCLSDDEAHLLHAASLVQAGENVLAERALRTALLSAAGAEFVLGPLQGLAELFAKARLFLRRRLVTAARVSPATSISLPSVRGRQFNG